MYCGNWRIPDSADPDGLHGDIESGIGNGKGFVHTYAHLQNAGRRNSDIAALTDGQPQSENLEVFGVVKAVTKVELIDLTGDNGNVTSRHPHVHLKPFGLSLGVTTDNKAACCHMAPIDGKMSVAQEPIAFGTVGHGGKIVETTNHKTDLIIPCRTLRRMLTSMYSAMCQLRILSHMARIGTGLQMVQALDSLWSVRHLPCPNSSTSVSCVCKGLRQGPSW